MTKKRAQLKRRTASRIRARSPAQRAPRTKNAAPDLQIFHFPEIRKGEVFAGMLLKEGKPTHHLILLPGEAEGVTWAAAKAFASTAGGELPTRKEQALLFANAPEHFQSAYYWSGEQYAGDAEYAWGQDFGYGCQYGWLKDYKARARAVRRVPI